MPDEVLDPFSFELVITGLCMFDITQQGATVLLVNAANASRFENDPDFQTLTSSSIPHPHFPRFSYLMTQQDRSNNGIPPRAPNTVVAGPLGEEAGICDLTGEDVTLVVPGGSPFIAGNLAEAPSLSSVSSFPVQRSPLASDSLPNPAVVTRFHFNNGALSVHRVSSAGPSDLEIDFRPINDISNPSGGPIRTIADQLLLRVDHVQAPIEIRSSTRPSILLRPEVDRDGNHMRPVRASLSNYHDEFHQPQDAAFDFLWFYEMVDFTSGQRPSRLDLPIPVYLNGPGGFTGSSGVCPPIKF